MFRAIWIISAFSFSAILAYATAPVLHGMLIDFVFSRTLPLELRQAMPVFSTMLVIFAITSALSGAGILVLWDNYKTRKMTEAISTSQPLSIKELQKTIEEIDYHLDETLAYINTIRQVDIENINGDKAVKTTSPAEVYFPHARLSRDVTFPNLYWAIAITLILSGISLWVKQWFIMDAIPPASLKGAISGLALSLIGATLMLAIVEGLKTSRQRKVKEFTDSLDRIFFIDQSLIFEKTLKQIDESLKSLEKTQSKITDTNTALNEQAVEKLLGHFINALTKRHGDQFQALNNALEANKTTAENLNSSYQDHLKQIGKNITTTFKSLKDSESLLIKSNGETIERLSSILNAHQKALEQAITALTAQNQELINKTTDDKTNIDIISHAAKNMLEASKAGRDTVESFIQLAERLREAGIAIKSPADHMAKHSGRDPETKKHFSEALRNLKRQVENH